MHAWLAKQVCPLGWLAGLPAHAPCGTAEPVDGKPASAGTPACWQRL